MVPWTAKLATGSVLALCCCAPHDDPSNEPDGSGFTVAVVDGRVEVWSQADEKPTVPWFEMRFDVRYDNTLGTMPAEAALERVSLLWHGRWWHAPWMPEPRSSGEVAPASAVTVTHSGTAWGETPFGIDCKRDWTVQVVLEIEVGVGTEDLEARRQIECSCHANDGPTVPDPRLNAR